MTIWNHFWAVVCWKRCRCQTSLHRSGDNASSSTKDTPGPMLQIGLGVQMHHHFQSKFLIESLNSHGFCCSCDEVKVESYDRSAVILPGMIADIDEMLIPGSCTVECNNIWFPIYFCYDNPIPKVFQQLALHVGEAVWLAIFCCLRANVCGICFPVWKFTLHCLWYTTSAAGICDTNRTRGFTVLTHSLLYLSHACRMVFLSSKVLAEINLNLDFFPSYWAAQLQNMQFVL